MKRRTRTPRKTNPAPTTAGREPAPRKRTRGTLAEGAYEALKERLLSGELPDDQLLSLDALAAQISSTRQPVTEAVKQMAAEGLLEVLPQVGCRVARPDPRELRDLFRYFAQSEGLLAELAAQRRTASQITELALIHSQIGALARLTLTPSEYASAYRKLNRQFHGCVHVMAQTPTLAALTAGLWDRSDLYFIAARGFHWSRRVRDSHREHDEVIEAIRDRDPTAARLAMERHLLTYGNAVYEAIP